MYLSIQQDICDIYDQNNMTEINSFDINSQFMVHACRSYYQLHDKKYLVVEWHLKLYFWMIWRHLKSDV